MPSKLDLLRLEWSHSRALRALPCMLAIAVALAVGLGCGRPGAGMVAAGGAMSVGLGSFQWLGRSRAAPMIWATAGMSISAMGGSLVGHSAVGAVVNAAFAGFGGGMLVALGPGASWIGLQCAVFALVAGGYPVGIETAVSRAALILGGGSLQTIVVLLTWRLRAPEDHPATDDPFEGMLPAIRTLWRGVRNPSEARRFAIRQSLTLAVAALFVRAFDLPNGYWVPMTALLVLKPDFQQTFQRSLARVAGTIVGAGLATLLIREMGLDPISTGLLVVLFAWLGYSLLNVNYGLFAICLTSYIVLLFDFGGISPHAVVTHRILNTALGGALALSSYASSFFRRKTGADERSVP